MSDDAAFWRGMTWVLVAYLTAFAAALLTAAVAPIDDPLLLGLAADVVATVVIWGFSTAFRNSSMYDAYWSVVPIALVAAWAVAAPPHADPVRQALVLGVVAFWGTRLTTNWATGWSGLDHEDWRYVRLRGQTGPLFPVVDLLGIHLFPTLLVFAGLWPAYVAMTSATPMQLIDLLAFGTCVGATVLEARADTQLRAFKERNPPQEAYIDEGLWAMSRHPNYLGEILFWWGLWLFAVACGPQHTFTVVGALLISALFRFISIPMMEKRMVERRPAYAEQIRQVPMLIPWKWRRGTAFAPAPVELTADDFPPDRITDEASRLSIDTLPYIAPPDEED